MMGSFPVGTLQRAARLIVIPLVHQLSADGQVILISDVRCCPVDLPDTVNCSNIKHFLTSCHWYSTCSYPS